MSDFLSAASSAMGIPDALVRRAAAARAADAGRSVDEVLQAWAGGASVAAAPRTEPTAPPESEAEPSPAETEPSEPAQATTPVPVPRPSGAPTRAAMPAEVGPREAARLPEVITVPTAGIRERTNSSIPRWLTTIFLAAPLFALFALGGLATGECGQATELRVDVVTGELVNCDGSEFTGSGDPGGGTDFVALGGAIYGGTGVTGVNCAGCHGAQGQGFGNFPAMGGVNTVFSSCTDHIEWVTLGAAGFLASGRPTYGDTGRPANAMPAFGNSLTPEQLASVVAFERVRFGGADPDQTLTDCGLTEPPDDPEEKEGEAGSGGAPTSGAVPSPRS